MICSNVIFARPTLGPPSINLRSSLANIVVVRLSEISTENKLIFKKVRDLHNKSEDIIIINSNPKIASSLELEKQYIIAYLAWKKTRRPIKVFPRPGGSVLINIAGAQPAIYSYSQSIEKLLTWKMKESLESPKQMLITIMSEIDNNDSQIQDFFVTELITRKNIHQWLKESDYQRIIKVLESPSTKPIIKEFILANINFMSNHISDDKLYSILINILNTTDTQFDIFSYRATLIRTSLVKIRDFKERIDSKSLIKWLYSNNNGVIESSLDSMRIINPKGYLNDIDVVLKQTSLSKKARTTIENYKNRMSKNIIITSGGENES